MKSTPIIPGKAYRVHFNGFPVVVIASNGADAIRSVLAAMCVWGET